MSVAQPYVTAYTNQTVAQVLLLYLAREGVTTIFGVPGGGVANLLVELKNQRNRFEYVGLSPRNGRGLYRRRLLSRDAASSASSWSRPGQARPTRSPAR